MDVLLMLTHGRDIKVYDVTPPPQKKKKKT